VAEGHTDSCLPSVARSKGCRLKVPMAELQLCASAVRLWLARIRQRASPHPHLFIRLFLPYVALSTLSSRVPLKALSALRFAHELHE